MSNARTRVRISDVVKAKRKANASTIKAKTWTSEVKAISPAAKTFNHTAIAEVKKTGTSDSLTG